MTSVSAIESNSALLDRLQMLEKENRKIKRFGAVGTSIEPELVTTYDSDNFHTFMGKMATADDRTGSTTRSTAASLKLVRKDGKVLWEAP